MTTDSGRLSGSRASTEPCGLGPSGFDPERVGGTTSDNYDPQYEASIMLPLLTAEQRDFIMRAKAHRRDQYLSARDWGTVEPCIELLDWPPYTVWFGGMRALSGAGRKGWKRTFRFNLAGLLLREAIAMEARRAETVKHGSVGDDSAAIAQPSPPNLKGDPCSLTSGGQL